MILNSSGLFEREVQWGGTEWAEKGRGAIKRALRNGITHCATVDREAPEKWGNMDRVPTASAKMTWEEIDTKEWLDDYTTDWAQ